MVSAPTFDAPPDAPRSPARTIAALFEALRCAATASAPTLGVVVHGEGGGTWVMDLPRGQLLTGTPAEAVFAATAVQLYAFADVIGDLFDAPERLTGHLSSGEIVVEGDRQVLVQLADQLSARPVPQSALHTRLIDQLPKRAA